MKNEKTPTVKELLRRIEQKENKISRLSGRASRTIGNMRLNEGINGSWKKWRNSMTSCGNLSAEEDKLKDLKQQLAELITSENEYTLNNFPQIVEKHLKRLKRFVKKHLDNATEDTDFWIEFNKNIDVHFSENDDEESAYFGQMEFWAYPIITDKFGNNTTDTNQWVQIKF